MRTNTVSVLVAAAFVASAYTTSASGVRMGGGVKLGGNGVGGEFDLVANRKGVATGFDAEADVNLGLVKGKVEVQGGAALELCSAHPNLKLDFKIKSNCKFFSGKFSERMRTRAHETYEAALLLYHDVMCLMRHTLMTRDLERIARLIEISSMIHQAEGILDNAETYNQGDTHFIRRKWIGHEIASLKRRLEVARFIAKHLPNLCLAEDVFDFAIDATVKVVKGLAAVPVIVGVAVVESVKFAAHLVAKAFHFMGRVLKWALEEVEFAFLVFRAKVKAGLHKIGEGLHKFGHALKEGFEDIGAVIVDIGHHATQHHHCHCKKADAAVIVVGGEPACDCPVPEAVSLTQVCTVAQKVCTKQEYTAKIHANYDIELKWDETTAVEQVQTTMTKINTAMGGLQGELTVIESSAIKENLELEAES